MKSRTTRSFREALAALSPEIREQARDAYRRFMVDPSHPGLRFKKVHPSLPIYSARVGRGYRALGTLKDDTIIWYWIGTHAEYDQLI